MFYRKFVNFLFFIISILVVNLVTTIVSDFIISFMQTKHPLKATLIGMILTVFILYPAFNKFGAMSDILTARIFRAGKNAAGKFFGIIWAFAVAFSILFFCYLYLWFHVGFFDFISIVSG